MSGTEDVRDSGGADGGTDWPDAADRRDGTAADEAGGGTAADEAGGGTAADGTGGAAEPGTGDLSAEDRAVLAFAARGRPPSGEKERAVREQLGMSPVRYYQYLNALLDDPRAARHDPLTVNRLRRLRQAARDRTH
ncbi:DUF3263 domain-containing protein [Streptomyces sp. WMMB303]|uniref:DUF3263 domain-containing protein n=1 Tax=Streptomyces sp. WMMB303 TaxID=3034154 RepID=UPI0023EAFFFC|nr:DUF3263 domain-containing protein [Streptomyces sp. WMMB303]MDF4251386.1 DUF3263 domain-containing protein [Streptomyces sp. WMMB303]